MRVAICCLLLTAGLLAAVPAPAEQSVLPATERQAEEVAAHLTGIMTTTQQAQSNSGRPDVWMTTCPVRLDGDKSKALYLYQEQAMSNKLNEPYRQRLLRIAASADGRAVESAGFKFVDAKPLAGLCAKPVAERLIPPMALDGDPTCTVRLVQAGDKYVGTTPEGGCPSNVRGAARITNEITLYKEGMDTRDRGFDAQGNQVWGAKEEPYRFRRLTP
ncbi:chromophore lyase CpcT/CpeT [Gloeobacter morelensis]|uniref:Chromophore lyase CpcT/CpeT n=1 Tax=Gloeobacter morelensis MG652769 TaxID=2781736 RepID=A0ABY3PP36_9CYAN|nr:chromophore lyase CpcT/CpeT [Gloeobacter morelensis]UFP95446.1 chromophore lyase CpcT/CpeT [Gloeobacter morelensis MG652769]